MIFFGCNCSSRRNLSLIYKGNSVNIKTAALKRKVLHDSIYKNKIQKIIKYQINNLVNGII